MLEKTGYPSIDKPWMKYYEQDTSKIEKCSLYHNIWRYNHQHLDDIAILYYGRKIKYRDMFLYVDKCASALEHLGVKKGDCISLCTSGAPEAIYLVLACSKIGAIANFVNPLFKKEQMIDRINDTEGELLFVLDKMYSFVEEAISKTCIKKVIIIPASISMSFIPKMITKGVCIKNNITNTIKWRTFLKWGIGRTVCEAEYEKDLAVVMVYSSGTTGASKGIVLTNDGINSTIEHYLSPVFPYKRGDRFLQIIPIWFSTGIVLSFLMPICLGVTVIPELVFSKESFAKDIAKYHPEMTLGATSLWQYAIKSKDLRKVDLSNMSYPITGGEAVSEQAEKDINSFLYSHGCRSNLIKGYGMCELGSTISTSSLIHSKYGSTGYPISGVMVAAFDENTNEELKYGERGEIRVCSPARMKGYFKNPEATKDFFKTDKKGNVWGCTGDIGYIDEDGDVFIQGRKQDSFWSSAGKKVYLFDIEHLALQDHAISQCKAIAIGKNSDIPVLHLVIKDQCEEDYKKIISRLSCKMKEEFPEYAQPKAYKIRSSFPVHPNGKRNNEILKNEKDGYIDCEGLETWEIHSY